jgi:signal transduction histidine kinase
VRFFISYLFIIGAVLLVLNIYPILAMQNSVFRMKQTSLENQASVVGSALSNLETLTRDEVGQVMNQLDTSGLNRLIVTDDLGCILFDTTENEDSLGKYALLEETTLALQGKDVFRSDYGEDAFRSRAAVPVMYHGVVIGCVYVYEYDSDQAALLSGLQQNLQKLSVAVVLAAFAVSFLVATSVTKKTSKLLRVIQSTAGGTPTQQVELRGHDEINLLAEEFNEMTHRLGETEEVRRRFVSDASHELKTPLASIRLLADSILQTENIDNDTMREFVGDIGEEAERLSRITEKLLALTRLDAGNETPKAPVELRDTIEQVLHMLRPLAQQREITLDTEIQTPGMMMANGDELYQIVFNLAENGVKYNVPQGWVKLSLREEGRELLLRVEDTGIGIPQAEREKIFDRFYRVDKARSREAGGTGLGLSIVRDMVKKYGGTIHCGPREGGGSWFQVSFPKEVEQ